MRGASPAALVIGLALGPTACYRANDFASCSVACASDQSCPASLACDPTNHICGTVGEGCPHGRSVDAPVDGEGDGKRDIDASATGCLAGPMLPGDFCPPSDPGPITLGVGTYSSDSCTTNVPNDAWSVVTLDLATGATACVVAADVITIEGAFRITGSRPLIMAAHSRITCTAGSIDVSSFTGSAGAGHGSVACASQLGGFGQGAAGGSQNMYVGGDGAGNGNNVAATVTTGLRPTSQLRGGCPGGDGGGEDKTGDTATHGEGGGAVYLRAPMIDIECQIDADAESGGGGFGGTNQGGGGAGGGAGGTVVFDATDVLVLTQDPTVTGGGGGGGGGTEQGSPGNTVTGGDGATPGNRGGDGSFTGNGNPGFAGVLGSLSGGGGGGGGASGEIDNFGVAPTNP